MDRNDNYAQILNRVFHWFRGLIILKRSDLKWAKNKSRYYNSLMSTSDSNNKVKEVVAIAKSIPI